jgi:hypothetical protein
VTFSVPNGAPILPFTRLSPTDFFDAAKEVLDIQLVLGRPNVLTDKDLFKVQLLCVHRRASGIVLTKPRVLRGRKRVAVLEK